MVSPLDKHVALVVIDIQKGIVNMGPCAPHSPQEVEKKCGMLAKAFRAAGHPVVLVTVDFHKDGHDLVKTRCDRPFARGQSPDEDFAKLSPLLEPNREKDVFITKHNWGAFHGTCLDDQLRRRGITQIVLCGIATCIGVESTARQANERNYNLVVVTDAVTDRNEEAHKRSIEYIFPYLSQTASCEEVLKAVAK